MPGIAIDGINEDEVNQVCGNSTPHKESSMLSQSPKSEIIPESPHGRHHLDLPLNGVVEVDTSIEKLYENVCEMQSSNPSPLRQSFESDGEESRIDSDLCHLVGGDARELEIMEEEVIEKPVEDDTHTDATSGRGSSSISEKSEKLDKTQTRSSKSASSAHPKKAQVESEVIKQVPESESNSPASEKPRIGKRIDKNVKKPNVGISSAKKYKHPSIGDGKLRNGTADSSGLGLDNPALGPFLLKQARNLISSGDNPQKALDLALQAAKSFEICSNGRPNLELVMCLHVIAAIYCSIGQYEEAIPVLDRSVEIPLIEEGQDHALAKFVGHMQLGDTYAMLGQLESSIRCYLMGLEVQKQVLGETDPRVGETCRYLAEAHVQALQLNEAETLCRMALQIHRENEAPASLEEVADRRLMGLICEMKGDYEAALEHLVLASMAMVSNGQEVEVAAIDCSIGDAYLSLSRYDEAVFAYQKALTVFKTTKGENHPSVASVFVRLAELYNKTGKLREAKSYCENALRIYESRLPGIPQEEYASGLTDVSAIYESMNELEEAIKLLKKVLKIYNNAPGQQGTIAGTESQIGIMHYMLSNYSESYALLSSAVSKLRASGEKKSAFFGIALNQMGLACIQLYSIKEAADLFEEAKSILEQEYGPHHPDTLGVYSNLAGTYDALGRLDDAIELLEYVVRMREEKLGTANPDVDDERRRLAELLKEAGGVRSRKIRSLEYLLDDNSQS